ASLTQTTLIKKLNYSDTLIVNGIVTNLSKNKFSTCNVNVAVIKHSKSDIQKFINKLKPLLKKSIYMDNPIEVNATKEFRVVFDNYKYIDDINVSIKSECY
ncbi:DUF2393 domain-containing protein, partial [Sulfurospirillum sp.]|nr:DUF2393 domain-containing protein [Sulfurospirillum sp.]